ncbi:MAG: hypothetical protein AAFU73_02665 [Planctomycetota bacterium]
MRCSDLLSSVRPAALVPAVLLAAAACVSPVTVPVDRSVAIEAAPSGARGSAQKESSEGPSTPEEFEEAIEEAQHARVKAHREAVYAEKELELLELERAAAEAEAAADELKAREELAAAEAALAAFLEIERGVDLDDAQNTVADAADRVIVAKTDLAGLQDIFAEETEARSKDEILRRAERSLARAEMRHSIAERRLALETEAKLPRRERDLRSKVAAAKAALELRGMKEARARAGRELERTKAIDSVDEKRRAAARAKAKLEELEAKAARVEGQGR